jgi:hypothetical protein
MKHCFLQSDVLAAKDIKPEDFLHVETPRATVVYDDGPSEGKICPIKLTRYVNHGYA